MNKISKEAIKKLPNDAKISFVRKLLEDQDIYKHFEKRGFIGEVIRRTTYAFSESEYTKKEIMRGYLEEVVEDMKEAGVSEEGIIEKLTIKEDKEIDLDAIEKNYGKSRWISRLGLVALALFASYQLYNKPVESVNENRPAAVEKCNIEELKLCKDTLKDKERELKACVEGLNTANRNIKLEADKE